MTQSVEKVVLAEKRSNEDRWLVYAVLGSKEILQGSTIDEKSLTHRVSILELDGVTIAIGPLAENAVNGAVTGQQIREFTDMVNELHRLGDILPFRFGTILSLKELFCTLEKNKSWYQTALQKIAGCSELCVRWAVPKIATESPHELQTANDWKPANGIEYLKSKARSKYRDDGIEREVSKVAAEIRGIFADACVDLVSSVSEMIAKRPGEEADVIYSVAKIDLLVRREAIASVRNAASLMQLQSSLPTIASGPWPPFSFVHNREKEISAIRPMQSCAKTCETEAVR